MLFQLECDLIIATGMRIGLWGYCNSKGKGRQFGTSMYSQTAATRQATGVSKHIHLKQTFGPSVFLVSS